MAILAIGVLLMMVTLIAPRVGGALAFGIIFLGGVAQLFWIVPLLIHARNSPSRRQGIITAAVIVALLNGGCWLSIGGLMWGGHNG